MSVVVCFSGGVDSTVLAELAHSRGELRGVVTFNYGQAAWSQEREAVTRWVDDHPGISAHRVSFGLHGADDAMNTGAGVAGPRVVPGRNLVFLAHAVAIASSLGANEVWYGATQDDRDAYPDCRVDFAHALSSAAVRGYGVRVKAPFCDMTKAAVVALGRDFKIDFEHTWSCYEPHDGKPCGQCNACVERREVLMPAGANCTQCGRPIPIGEPCPCWTAP